jgi:DNA polymerase III delta prime subunit
MLALSQRPFCWDDICGQKAIIQEMKKRSLTRDFPSVLILGGESGTGKAQPLTSEVLTPSGYTLMGDLKIGDKVIDGLGKLTEVTGVYPQGEKEVYRLIFSDGTSTLCTEDHLWKIYWAKGHHPGFRVMSLRDIMIQGFAYTKPKAGWNQWYVRLPIPCVSFEERPVEVDPYLLGVLIGDGCLGAGSFSVSLPEDDIREKARKILRPFGYSFAKKSQNNYCYDYNITFFHDKSKSGCLAKKGECIQPLKEKLRRYGLLCKSIEKHIPSDYLFNSVDIRLKLLQGLMDTDGTIDRHLGQLSYATSSPALSRDFAFLVRSLGGTDSVRTKSTSYIKDGERIHCSDAFIHYLKFPDTITPVTSKKHIGKLKKHHAGLVRSLHEVKKEGRLPCQCIQVASSDQTYITNDFIVTHNTTVALIIAALLNDENPLKGNGCLNPNPESPESKAILNETFNMSCSMYDASRMAKEDVMRLEETVSSASMFGGKRVLIVDESQELSKTSKGITLKLLEKKRRDAYIILCTMNPDAFDKSVRSRGLYYQFRSPSSFDIAEYLFKLTDQFGKDVPDSFIQEGLIAIAENCEGSVRMAVQNLERCLAGELYTAEAIQNAFGFMSNAKLFDMVSKILNQNVEVFKDIRAMDLK